MSLLTLHLMKWKPLTTTGYRKMSIFWNIEICVATILLKKAQNL